MVDGDEDERFVNSVANAHRGSNIGSGNGNRAERAVSW